MKKNSRPSSKGKPSSGKKPDSGKGGKGKKKGKKEAEPFVSKYPDIDYTNLMTVPKIDLRIKLINTKSEFGYMEITVPSTYSLAKIVELINIKHSFSCKNIKLFMEISGVRKNLDKLLYLNFQELDQKGELDLFYEFDPVIHPLLEAGLV